MRFLGVGETNDLGDMYLRLAAEGHEVRVHVSDAASHDVMEGMLNFTPDWSRELSWIRDAGNDGVILFETASAGETQDQLRRDGFHVIGGSAFGDRLESERDFAQEVLGSIGMNTARTRSFTSVGAAIAFLERSPGRYVFKLNGINWLSARNYVGQMEDGADMLALLEATRALEGGDSETSFILMDYIEGVEVGVGAFFNGVEFLNPSNLDWEHKRFFPGDVGELTGEMGTLVTYRGGERLFEHTLAKLAPLLRESGYCGYINLNTIVNEAGVWPLELTSRFGYPGYSILDSLHDESWASLFSRLIHRNGSSFQTKGGYSVGVVITVPPFPYADGYSHLGKGTPICFRDTMTAADRKSLHYGEVTLRDGQLVTAGMIGYAMVVTGTGDTAEEARDAAYQRVSKVVIPNARYRNDIGARFMREDCATMRALGWID